METQAPYNVDCKIKKPKMIFVCSPLRGDVEGNIKKAKGYCREIVLKGNIPIAPHIYFTQFLNENSIIERNIGINAGIELLKKCDELWVFSKMASEGMTREISKWIEMGNKPFWVYKDLKNDL